MFAFHYLLGVLCALVFPAEAKTTGNSSWPLDWQQFWWKHNEPIVQIYDWLSAPTTGGNETRAVCLQSIRQLVSDARAGKNYAQQVFDSVGRLGSGMLQGQFIHFGEYEQCISTADVHFSGQYCLLNMHAPGTFYQLLSKLHNTSRTSEWKYSTLKMKLGICLPSTCSIADVQSLGNKFSQMFKPPLSIPAVQCITEPKVDVLSLALFSGFIALLAVLLLVGSLLHHFNREEESSPVSTFRQILLSFSVQVNLPTIFQVKKSKSDSIDVFHGMRFFAMLSIISFHSFAMGSLYIDFSNPMELWQDLLSPVLVNGALSVDTFFFISGFLVSHIMLRQFSKSPKIQLNLWQLYVKRYLRMTPTMMVLVAFGAVVMRYVGNGPEWMIASFSFDDFCRKNWWINLLYVQNFIRPSETCLTHTWYSAVDTQFYVISPFLVLLLFKKPKLCAALCLAFFVGSIVGTWVITVQHNYPAVSYFTSAITTDQLVGYYNSIYIKPYFRIGPYLVGILLAYVMHKNAGKAVTLHKRHYVTGWVLSLSALLAITLALYPTHQGNILEIHLAATYSAIARILWACCLAWITFACKHNYGGIFSKFLSLKVWQPLSHLTYCTYLVHPFVLAIFYGRQQKPFEYSFILMLYFTIGHLVISYLLSAILALTIEYPFVAIGQIILKKFNHQKPSIAQSSSTSERYCTFQKRTETSTQ